MARKKFEDGFKENAIAYCQAHPEKTIKACAADIGVGYSTLRRWISQMEEEAQADVGQEAAETGSAEMEPVADESLEAVLEEAATVLEEVITDLPAEKVTPVVESAEATVEEEITEAAEAPVEEAAEEVVHAEAAPADDWEDDIAFASVGMYSAPTRPDNDDFLFRCKSNAQAARNIPHNVSDTLISACAQVGNVVEDVTKGVHSVISRAGLYKKRFELENERRKIQKEKQKRQKR